MQPRLDAERLVFIDETWASTNMARRMARGQRGARITADSSFALLTAETETAAAEALADWLAAGGATGRTIIVADRATAALDAALARRHLPALGVAAPSAQRGVLQLLPLVLATCWRPFDAALMLQLLQARPSPIARAGASGRRRLMVGMGLVNTFSGGRRRWP